MVDDILSRKRYCLVCIEKKGGNPYEINFEYIVKCIGQDTLVVSMKNVKKRKEVEELRLLL